MYAVSGTLKNDIFNNVVTSMFKNLPLNEKYLILHYVEKVINFISVNFGFYLEENENANESAFEHQFTQNNYSDVESIIYLLLPYIDDPTGEKKRSLEKLSDIYTKKYNESDDINEVSPKYLYSNMQYNMCMRRNYNIGKGWKKKAIERNINPKIIIRNNFRLVKDTIVRVANKLHVNWSDITPYTMDTFMDSKLYTMTYNAFLYKKMKYVVKKKDKNEDDNYGLSIGDIFDVTYNNLFKQIVNIRWLIYELIIDGNITTIYTLLNAIFEENTFAKTWNDIDQEMKDNFKFKFEKMLRATNDININKIALTVENIKKMLLSLAFYFDGHYSKRHVINYKKLKNITEQEDIIFQSKDIKHSKVIKTLVSIDIKDIHNFIYECFAKFRETWFWMYLHENDVALDIDKTSEKIIAQGYSPKNMYNFAKSLTHYQREKDFIEYGSNWEMVLHDHKKEFVEKINDKIIDYSYWFNIRGNIKYLYDTSNNMFIDKVMAKIYKHLRSKFIENIFRTMIMNGILTKFYPNKFLTDDKYQNEPLKTRLKAHINSEMFDSGHNYINNIPFSKCYVDIQINNKKERLKYIDYIINEKPYVTTIATLNWINQISFFHRYLNNRVVFVTGGTGVGKSSQVPKLALYAMKCLTCKYDGKIVCSQPTVSSTSSIAVTMSNELGVQIYKTINDENSAKSSNYEIQFITKNKEESHYKNIDKLSLRFCTDGLLLMNVMSSPILLKSVNNGQTFLPENIMDIVMVDESHTHNPNMDMILTMMKFAIFYNNTIKLFIISATMDEDEPYYRRYYRDVNDNRMYPINLSLFDRELDRIVVDRRYHVGAKYQHKITEYYVPNLSVLDVIDIILKKSEFGDILVFQTGAVEIKKIVSDINKVTPQNVLALPLYGAMSERERKKITEKFSSIRSKIVSSKTSKFDTIDIGDSSPYTRFIIVATNIVEASITIDSLRYVIDNGYYKSMTYDYVTEDVITNDRTEISEQSRLQRRGRVGRVAPGTVYYLYKQESRKENRQSYNIATTNITTMLFNLLAMDNSELLIGKNSDNLEFSNKIAYRADIDKFVKKYYYVDDKFYFYEGDSSLYDYNNKEFPSNLMNTGYKSDIIKDIYGKFYIVHPEENMLKRNILGNIVKVSGDVTLYDNKIYSKKMNSFFDTLIQHMFIFEYGDSYYKTEYGKRIIDISSALNIFYEDDTINYCMLISYLYSKKYKCDGFLHLMAFYYACSFDLMNVYKDKSVKTMNNYGDSQAIINELKTITNLNVHATGKSPTDIRKLLKMFVKIHNKKERDEFTKSLEINIPETCIFNNNFVYKYYRTYMNLVYELHNIEKKDNALSWFDDKLVIDEINSDSEYKYSLCLLQGFFKKLFMNIGEKYIKLSIGGQSNVFTVKTQLTDYSKYDYLLCLLPNSDKKELHFVHGIRETDVYSMINMFNNDYILYKAPTSNVYMDIINKNLTMFKKRIKRDDIGHIMRTKYNRYDSRDKYKQYLSKIKIHNPVF